MADSAEVRSQTREYASVTSSIVNINIFEEGFYYILNINTMNKDHEKNLMMQFVPG